MATRLFRTDVSCNRIAVGLLGACMAVCVSMVLSSAPAQAEAPKALRAGDILSGDLTAMRSGKRKNRVVTYQLTSAPRRLPPPAGLCNLETGQRRRSGRTQAFRRQDGVDPRQGGGLRAGGGRVERRHRLRLEPGDAALTLFLMCGQPVRPSAVKWLRRCSHASSKRLGIATSTQITKNSGQPVALAT